MPVLRSPVAFVSWSSELPRLASAQRLSHVVTELLMRLRENFANFIQIFFSLELEPVITLRLRRQS